GLPTDERDWQLYFTGRLAGKGMQQSRPVVVRIDELGIDDKEQGMDEPGLDGMRQGIDELGLDRMGSRLDSRRERELVNLEMVHIKRRGERHEGVEVILQDGLYGFMYNGSVTAQPRYVRVHPLRDGGEYFALADYPQGVMNGRRTVISSQGVDLQMALYGDVRREGDFFIGRNIRGERCYWDGIGREYYREMPTFRNYGGLDLKPFVNGRYRLRRWPNLFVNGLKIETILSNKDIAIIDNKVLIVKTAPQRTYRIVGYRPDCVLVDTSRGMTEIREDGTVGETMRRMPDDFQCYPVVLQMHLQAVR
ncbi:MAG: hypothetical protein IJ637_09740, partial [Prevotella sp.]|nr:hypothetical protein [Prevotella sp.]